jgi:hypothetical protein
MPPMVFRPLSNSRLTSFMMTSAAGGRHLGDAVAHLPRADDTGF